MKTDILRLNEISANEFCRLRMDLFEELGEINKYDDITELRSAIKQYYLSHINKDLICWGIFKEEKLAAVGSLCLFARIPYKENLSGLEGYILNIYTSPEFRNRGFANRVLDDIIDYSQKNNIGRLWLNSSEQGMDIYKRRGFIKINNGMELFL